MKKVLSKMKGSILAYTLIILFVILTASLGMFASSLKDLRSSGTQARSMQAFNVASSGSEMAVAAIKKNRGGTLGNELLDALGSGASCNGGEITKSSFLGGDARLTFFDDDGTKLACDANVSQVASVKSVGTFKETARAVEVAVAAGCSESEGILVAESPDKTYDSDDINDIKNFLAVKGHVFSGFFCEYEYPVIPPQTVIASASGGGVGNFNDDSDELTLYANDLNALLCKGGECANSWVCSGGWAIFGSCAL